MPVTEFDDSEHYGLFLTNANKLDSSTTKRARLSELTLAALRAAGFLDNMIDGLVPPVDLSLLWLDKNLDPAVLKEWNPVGANWEQVTSQTLFGRVPWKGAWAAPSIYRIGDIVSYLGAIWIAVQTSQNHTPAEDAYWDLFLEAVTDGAVTTAKLADGAVTRPKLSDELANTIPLSPLAFGATGDGTTDDHLNYALAEAANGNVFLPGGKTFDLVAALPTKPVYGPGSLKINGTTVKGDVLGYDVVYGNVIYAPENYAEKAQGDPWAFPEPNVEPDHVYNVVISPGFNKPEGDLYRNTFVGYGIGKIMEASSFTDAFGADCLAQARYSQRNTIIGTLGCPWLGQDLTTDPTRNPLYPDIERYYEHDVLQDNGLLWTDPEWDVFGLKTRNPGVVAQLSAWVASDPWVDSVAPEGTDPSLLVLANVVVGRDAMNQKVIGIRNSSVGYRSNCLNLDGSHLTALGYNANFANLFGNGSTAVGSMSLQDNQDGSYNTAVGYRAGGGVVHGSNNLFLGVGAGQVGVISDETIGVTVNRSVFLGPFSGQGYTGSSIADVFVLSNAAPSSRGGLIEGKFATQQLAVGALPAGTGPFAGYRDAKLTVYAGASGVGAISAAANTAVIESSGNVGVTFTSPNTATASIYFADPEQAFAGYVQYNHTSDYLRFGVGAAERMRLTGAGMGFNGATAIAKPSGYGAPTGTATRSAFATGSVTTAQLAERVKALIDDLTSYGLIGT